MLIGGCFLPPGRIRGTRFLRPDAVYRKDVSNDEGQERDAKRICKGVDWLVPLVPNAAEGSEAGLRSLWGGVELVPSDAASSASQMVLRDEGTPP
jgi:hypothetical protein